MTINADEYRPRIGLDSLYVAAILGDDANAYSVDTPVYLAPAAEASLAPATSSDVLYADDQPYETMSAEAETKITLKVTAVPIEVLAAITGRVFDAGTGQLWDNAGASPYYALGFRSLKSNGSYRYYWFLKGQFEMPSEDMATKGSKPEPKVVSLTYTAIKTIYQFDLGSIDDSLKRVVGDEDTMNFDPTGWFTAVMTPAYVAGGALTLSSSVPADNEGAFGKALDITLTFSNALTSGVTGIQLLTASTAANFTHVTTIDVTKKIITINPTGNLANVEYIVTYHVVDIYGQVLDGAINFTAAP